MWARIDYKEKKDGINNERERRNLRQVGDDENHDDVTTSFDEGLRPHSTTPTPTSSRETSLGIAHVDAGVGAVECGL